MLLAVFFTWDKKAFETPSIENFLHEKEDFLCYRTLVAAVVIAISDEYIF